MQTSTVIHPDFDTAVKLTVYTSITETAEAPSATEVAERVGASPAEVEAAFARLHAKRLLVPEPGDPSRIRMAPPFSGVVTPFLVEAKGRRYYANCVWDGLGIPAALHEDAVISASDGFTGEPLALEVKSNRSRPRECVIHFAVPAARWWEDIIYT